MLYLLRLLTATFVFAVGHDTQAPEVAQCAGEDCEIQSLLQVRSTGGSSQELGPLPPSPTPPPPQEPKLRFRKRNSSLELPLVVYPMTNHFAGGLTDTAAVSLRWFDSEQAQRGDSTANEQVQLAIAPLKTFADLQQFVWDNNAPSFAPTHPDDTGADQESFWNEFLQVVAFQQARMVGMQTADYMTMHPMFEREGDPPARETLQESALRVQKDFPSDFPNAQVKRFLATGLTLDPDIFERKECCAAGEFVNGAVALSALCGWAVAAVSPAAFASKWHEGRLRPEETAWLLQTGRLNASAELQEAIEEMGFPDAAGFTAYEEGSPVHPSWPAMHASASGISTWLDIVGNLTEEQREETRLLDFNVAWFRTVAGVHYPTDNRAGLALGQHVVRAHLPDYLASHYACNAETRTKIKEHVIAKIKRLEEEHPLDWGSWTPEYFNPPGLMDMSGYGSYR